MPSSFSSTDLEYMFWDGIRNGSIGTVGAKGDAGGFTLTTAIPALADLNTYITPGMYHVAGVDAGGIINSPRPGSGIAWNLYVFARSSTVVTQHVEIVNNGLTMEYRRSLVSNIWGPWDYYMPIHIEQTAGRVFKMYDYVNSRDQIIYSDTGLRNIGSLFPDLASGGVILRRVDQTVTLLFSNTEFTDTSANTVHNYAGLIPLGFRNFAASRFPLSPSAGQVTVYGSSGNVDVVKGTTIPLFNEISWTTNDSWPASLPGTSAASIPYQ